MRVVLDTNVLVSALLWKDTPYQLFEAVVRGETETYSSAALVAELEEVLGRRHLLHKLIEIKTSVAALILRYRTFAHIVEPAEISRTVLADPDDDAVLACALAAQVDLIVSGDPDLLNLKYFHRIPILTPAAALDRIMQQRSI